MVDVSDEEYRVLKGAHKLMDGLMRDPKTRTYTERLIKAKHPNVVTSDDDPRVQELRAVSAKVDKFMADQENEKINAKLEAGFNKLRNQYSYTDDGIKKIKEIMVAESIPNPEAAAAWWEKQNPPKPQEPSIYEPNDWGFNRETEDADLKLLWGDEDAWSNREIARTLNDFRKNGGEE